MDEVVVFLRCRYSSNVERVTIGSEDARSWLSIYKYRYAKKDWELINEQEYTLQLWANRHRYDIGKAVERLPAVMLEQVAKLIDFKPGEENGQRQHG